MSNLPSEFTSTVLLGNECTYILPVYSSMNNAEKRAFANLRCSRAADTLQIGRTEEYDNSDPAIEYRAICIPQCLALPDCYAVTKSILPGDSFRCLFLNCTGDFRFEDRNRVTDRSVIIPNNSVCNAFRSSLFSSNVSNQPTSSPSLPTSGSFFDNLPTETLTFTSNGCTMENIDYLSLPSSQLKRQFATLDCQNKLGLSVIKTPEEIPWRTFCLSMCLSKYQNCNAFNRLVQGDNDSYRCEFLSCNPYSDASITFLNPSFVTNTENRAGWIIPDRCDREDTSNTPPPTTPSTNPNSQDVVSYVVSPTCTVYTPDYPSLSTEEKGDSSTIECTRDEDFSFGDSELISNNFDWKQVCLQRCIETSGCRSMMKVFESTAFYRCRLFTCSPLLTGNPIRFVNDASPNNRYGWADLSCFDQSTLPPTPPPVQTQTIPVETTTFTFSPTCSLQYPNYAVLSNAQKADYSTIQCTNQEIDFAFGDSTFRSDIADWKIGCTQLCLETNGCRSVMKVFIDTDSYSCRMFTCTPLEGSNAVTFIPDQSPNNRYGWLEPSCFTTPPVVEEARNAPNVLFMIADDLSSFEYIPSDIVDDHYSNLKELQRDAFDYKNAFTMFPVCSPSRISMLTGRTNDKLKIYNFDKEIDPTFYETVPSYFKLRGYHVAGFGKIFHNKNDESRRINGVYDRGFSQPVLEHDDGGNNECPGNRYFCSTSNEQDLTDYKITTAADNYIKQRHRVAPETPWMAFVGFRRPHINLALPEGLLSTIRIETEEEIQSLPQLEHTIDLNYYQCDKMAEKQIPIYEEDTDDFLEWQSMIEGTRNNVRDVILQEKYTVRKLRQAYHASIKFIDTQIGRLIHTMKTLGVYDNTIIIFTSDHGWLHGEFDMFCKNTLYDPALRVPLLIKPPHNPIKYKPVGRIVDENNVVNLIDLFPTLIDLTGLTDEENPSFLDGNSLYPTLLNDYPNYSYQYASYSQYMRCQPLSQIQTRDCINAQAVFNDGSCSNGGGGRLEMNLMGYSMHTIDNYQFIEWREFVETRTTCLNNIWQFDEERTLTNWNRPFVQRNLYFRGVEIPPPFNATISSFVQRLSRMIELRSTNQDDPCNARGLLMIENNRCECLVEGWSGTFCNVSASSTATSSPTTTRTTRTTTTVSSGVVVPIVVIVLVGVFAIVVYFLITNKGGSGGTKKKRKNNNNKKVSPSKVSIEKMNLI